MRNLIIYVSLGCFLSGCSAIFEKSIANQSIDIYIPADSFKTKLYSQQFYWEKVAGATSYRLQIVSPSFNSTSIKRFILDTIMSVNSITVTLSPGEYEWRLRAQNGGSETAYYTRKLFINQTTFDQRPISIKMPSSSFSSYQRGIPFEWFAVSGAQNYTIEIDTFIGTFTNPMITTVDFSQLIANPVLQKRGHYKWRMFADSAGTKSMYSSTGYIDFLMDTVGLYTPDKNAINVSQNPDLIWNKPVSANRLSTDQYTYELYLYSSLNPLVLVTDYSQSMPIAVPIANGETIQLKGLTKGKTYYWAIIAVDQYNVKSQLTSKRKFTVSS